MTKTRFTFKGVTFNVALHEHYNKSGYTIDPVTAGKMVKQYCKAKYPDLIVKVASERYSGGNSLNVYVCNPDATQVDSVIYADIKEFADLWQEGHFDGMIDMYEYSDAFYTASTDSGYINLIPYTKYVFAYNRTQFDTPEWIQSEVLGGRSLENTIKYARPNVVEQWKKKYAA